MSGHSKWSNIKHRKGAQDAKRAKVFTKLLKVVRVAVREGGTDPETNASLRLAIERAKSFNVPKDTIERALSKDDDVVIEEVTLDAIGPGKSQIIIECTTDNKNRTIPDMRSILEKTNGKLAQDGAARWAFSRSGFITLAADAVSDTDELLLSLIDEGAQDIRKEDGSLVIITAPDAFARVLTAVQKKGLVVEDATLGWDPTQRVDLSEEDQVRLEKLIDALDDHDDVQTVWTNGSS